MDSCVDKYRLDKTLEAYIENEVERRIKEYPVYVRINGETIEAEIERSDGQIDATVLVPIYFPETGKMAFVNEAEPNKMAI